MRGLPAAAVLLAAVAPVAGCLERAPDVRFEVLSVNLPNGTFAEVVLRIVNEDDRRAVTVSHAELEFPGVSVAPYPWQGGSAAAGTTSEARFLVEPAPPSPLERAVVHYRWPTPRSQEYGTAVLEDDVPVTGPYP